MNASVPPTTVQPSSLAEAVEVFHDSRGAVRIVGAGTKHDWGVEPAPPETVVSTSALADLVRYDPDDATATVQAGMPLDTLQKVLAEHNQQLAVDPPYHGATVGGTFIAGAAGPHRLASGTMRDLVIGLTTVLSDGSVGRSGGNVIKNVAGYDLGRLLAGSLGTLGFVVDMNLKLDPLPETSATLEISCDPSTAARATTALLAAPVEPVAVDWADGALWVRYEGVTVSVDGQVGATRTLLADFSGGGNAAVHQGADERAVWDRIGAAHAGDPDDPGVTVVQAVTLPSALGETAAALASATDHVGVTATLASHAGSGVHHAVLTASDATAHAAAAGSGVHHAVLTASDATAHAAVIRAWREQIATLGGHVVVRARAHVDRDAGNVWDTETVWGPTPSAIGLMRTVKEQLDPQYRLAPGLFVGGI